MTNPWVWLGALVAALAIFAGGYGMGHGDGVRAQKVADQVDFDKLNAEVTENKRVANIKIREGEALVQAKLEENLKLLKRIGEQDAKKRDDDRQHAVAIARERSLYINAAQTPGCGRGGIGAVPGSTNSTGDATSTIVELDRSLTSDLRQWAEEEQGVHRDYEACYAYAVGKSSAENVTH